MIRIKTVGLSLFLFSSFIYYFSNTHFSKVEPVLKRAKTDQDEDYCEERDYEAGASPTVCGPCNELISAWDEQASGTRLFTVMAWLPSGIDTSMMKVAPSDNGKNLVIKCIWPSPVGDIKMLQKSLRDDPAQDMEVLLAKDIGFLWELRSHRDHANAPVISTIEIRFPFMVKPHMEMKKNFDWNGSTARSAYALLSCLADQYSETVDNDAFVQL